MAKASDVLRCARSQIGVKESPAGSNCVRYNTDYYGRAVRGSAYPWCVVFQWWCFRAAGGSDLFYGGGRTASCAALLRYHRGKGREVTGDLRPGDLVFFNFSGGTRPEHVGLCEAWGKEWVTTIDGNTGSGSESDGGAVMRRTRPRRWVVAAVRPEYEQEDGEMTGKEIYEALQAYLAQQSAPEWAAEELAAARAAGITDGTAPMGLIPRYQAALMAYRALRRGREG